MTPRITYAKRNTTERSLELEFGAVLSNLKHTQHTHKPQRPIDSSLWPTTIDMVVMWVFWSTDQ